MSNNTLVNDFLQAINDCSFYNAGEGNCYWEETSRRLKAAERLEELKAAMVEQFGKQETLRIANSRPHLLFSELYDLAD